MALYPGAAAPNNPAEHCTCTRCGERFVDELAFDLHKPLGALIRTRECRFPKSIYRGGDGVWQLRPNARAAVEQAEDVPAVEFEPIAAPARTRQIGPSIGAGSRGSLVRKSLDPRSTVRP